MNARRDGFILVAALWMLAALAGLASVYAVYAVELAPSAALPEERLRAHAALRAGVELCAFRQLAWPKPARPDMGAFSAQVGAARIDVAFRAETARVDLNAAPRELVAGLIRQLGVSDAAADSLADRVVAWRHPLSDDARAQEAAIYSKAGLTYAPTGAPFDNALEIALLPGMTPALVGRALPFLTVSGAAKINPFVAEPTVLAALPGATPAVVKALLAARAGPRPDAATLARIAGRAQDAVSAEPVDTVRADIVATLARRSVHAEVVLKVIDGSPEPYQILSWRDDFDGE